MDKATLWNQLIEQVSLELEQAERAARDAADYATDDEAKAKSKWDTQGLEASYLAAGQAKKVGELRDAINKLRELKTHLPVAPSSAREGCLVTVEFNGEETPYLLVPAGGGIDIGKEHGEEIWTLTPPTPLGQRIIGRSVGNSFLMPNGASAKIISIQ